MNTEPSHNIQEHAEPERLEAPSKFLVCVDKGEASRVALRFACFKASKTGGRVDILHIIEPTDFQSLFAVADKMREERRQEAENLLKRLSEEANACGVTPSLLLRDGKIGDEILKAATEDAHVNMLVLGVTPGSSNRWRLIAWLSTQMGDSLLVPVMLVPGNLTDQQIQELS